jgi:WD40 repeat protein
MFRLSASPDGKRVALLNSQHVVHVFDAATGKPAAEVAAHGGPVAWVGWAPDGRTVHTADATAVMSWTLKGERTATAAPRELRDGRLPPFVSGNPLVWSVPDEEGKKWELVGWDAERRDFAWRMPVGEKSPDRLFTHDGKQVVGVSWDGGAKRWAATVYDGPAGKVRHERSFTTGGPGGRIGAYWWPGLALSGDGKRLFVADADVQVLDLATGNQERFSDAGPTRPEHTPGLPLFAVSPDGTRLVTVPQPDPDRSGGALTVYDVKSGKRHTLHQLEPVHQPGIAFSPTGKHLMVYSMWGPVLVYDVESDAKPRALTVLGARPTCAAFSPNGGSLAVGYQDGTALIWDLSAK